MNSNLIETKVSLANQSNLVEPKPIEPKEGAWGGMLSRV
jgi:hypothetical protein